MDVSNWEEFPKLNLHLRTLKKRVEKENDPGMNSYIFDFFSIPCHFGGIL